MYNHIPCGIQLGGLDSWVCDEEIFIARNVLREEVGLLYRETHQTAIDSFTFLQYMLLRVDLGLNVKKPEGDKRGVRKAYNYSRDSDAFGGEAYRLAVRSSDMYQALNVSIHEVLFNKHCGQLLIFDKRSHLFVIPIGHTCGPVLFFTQLSLPIAFSR